MRALDTTQQRPIGPSDGPAILLVITPRTTETSEKRREEASSTSLYSPILTQGFVANAQKLLSFATTRGLMKPAALSFSVRPSFRCPE